MYPPILFASATSRRGRVQIVAWVLAWYGISVSMVVANNWLFHPPPHGLDFKFPILTTMVHMWMKLFLSRWIFWYKVRFSYRFDSYTDRYCTVYNRLLLDTYTYTYTYTIIDIFVVQYFMPTPGTVECIPGK